MHRRSFLSLTALTLVATACGSTSSSSSSSSSALPAVMVGLTYIPNIQFAPFYVAKSKGLFTGANVVLRHHGASEGLFTALAAGQENLVIAGGDEMLQAVAGGMDLVAIASYYHAYPVVVIVPASSSITTTAGLRGKRIGIPGRYGESWFGLQVALKSGGLTLNDVHVVEIGYTQQAALASHKVDATIGFSNNDAVQFRLAGVAIRTIPLAASVPLVSICLITSRAYLNAHPDICKAVADGMVAGVRECVNDPAGAITTSVPYIPGLSASSAQASARATLDATLAIMRTTSDGVSGKLNATTWASMASFMRQEGLISKSVDPATTMSDDHVSA